MWLYAMKSKEKFNVEVLRNCKIFHWNSFILNYPDLVLTFVSPQPCLCPLRQDQNLIVVCQNHLIMISPPASLIQTCSPLAELAWMNQKPGQRNWIHQKLSHLEEFSWKDASWFLSHHEGKIDFGRRHLQ